MNIIAKIKVKKNFYQYNLTPCNTNVILKAHIKSHLIFLCVFLVQNKELIKGIKYITTRL